MFIGHFALGFGGKVIAPSVSLGTMFMAAQFIDLLWPTLLLFGVERASIVPGATAVTPLAFDHYPYSHSLAATLGWAVLVGSIHYAAKRGRIPALIVGALVVSHWILDAVVHRPDLALFPGSSMLIGLGVWSSLPATLAIEMTLFAIGLGLYSRTTSPIDAIGRWGLVALVAFLLCVYAANLLGPAPPSVVAIAWAGQLQWLFVLWGYWVDKHRVTSARR